MNRKQLADQSGTALGRYQPQHGYEPSGHHHQNSEEAAPNVFASIWRWRWAVLSITVCFIIGSVMFLRVMPPSYTAQVQLTITPPQNPMATTPAAADASLTYLTQQTSIMTSAVVCDAAAQTVLKDTSPSDEDIHLFSNRLRDHLATDVGKTDNVITISFTDKNADRAAAIVNAVIQSYINYVNQTQVTNSNGLLKVLSGQKEKAERRHQAIQQQLALIRQNNPTIQFLATNAASDQNNELTQLYQAHTQAILADATAEANYNTAQANVDDPIKLEGFAGRLNFVSPDISPKLAQVRSDIENANRQLLLDGQNLMPGSAPILHMKAVLQELRFQEQVFVKTFDEQFLTSLDEAKTQAEENIKSIQAKIDKVQHESAGVNNVQGQYQQLLAEDTALSAQIATLDSTIQSTELKVNIDMLPSINVLQQARGEDAMRSPDPTRVLVLSFGAGLAIGVAFALIRDKLDQRVRSAEEIAALLGLPVVGVVPHMKSGLTSLAKAQAVHWDPMSEVSEAYRAVRTAVHFGVQAGQARTIVVTSPTPGDGKSTLASNLAISFAQAGKHTLLLDADFRRPVQHRMFEIKDNETGLTSVLAGQQTLSKAIRRTVVEGLDLLPAGPLPLNPSELLNGESFAAIIEELMQKYDHIVLDCPPVVAVTDARILGALSDLALLVLRAGKTTRQHAELARNGLLSVGTRLLGVVVNDVPRGEDHYGYYGSYAYHSNTNSQMRLTDETEAGTANGHSKPRRRLPSPSGVDSM